MSKQKFYKEKSYFKIDSGIILFHEISMTEI